MLLSKRLKKRIGELEREEDEAGALFTLREKVAQDCEIFYFVRILETTGQRAIFKVKRMFQKSGSQTYCEKLGGSK